MRSSHAWIGIVALDDSGARANPFIRGIHPRFEIEVGDRVRRDVARDTSNLRSNHSGHDGSANVSPRLYALVYSYRNKINVPIHEGGRACGTIWRALPRLGEE